MMAVRGSSIIAVVKFDERRLAAVFESDPAIQAVYLFGSVAEGRMRTHSDIDLGVAGSLHGRDAGAYKLDLLTRLAEAGFDNVDLVFLDRASIVTRYQAVRLNRLVYRAPGFDRGTLYSRVIREYLDFLPFLEVQRRAYKLRLLNAKS